MKLRILLLVYLLFLASPVFAQNTTVTVGTATTNPAGSDTPFGMINGSSTYSRFAGKYPGLSTGVIKKIRWYKTSSAAVNNAGQELRIYFKQGQFNWNPGINISWASEIVGATLVYSNSNQSIASGTGWQEFILNTPFTWNSTTNQNLAVFVEWSNPGPLTPTLKWAAPSSSNSHYMQNANGFPASLMNGGASRLPSTQFVIDPLQLNDAGISAVLNPGPTGLQTGVATPLEVRLSNFGSNTITSATIGWSINGVAGIPFNFTGSVASLGHMAVTIGNHTFTAGTNTIKAWTSNPNGVTDPETANDTITLQVEACTPMAGTYTILPGSPSSATNFNSLTAAMQRLKTCGVGGAVTFTLAPNSGPYNEAIELVNIPGASTANSVTINGQGNTLQPAAVFGELAVVKLDSASHIVINDFNLVVSNTAMGYGVHLVNHSDSVTISNCTITLSQQLSPSLVGILIGHINSPSTTPRSSNLSIINNTIIGGESGITINQNSNNLTGTDAANILITGNTIKDFRQFGIKLSTVTNARVTKNDISRPGRVAPYKFFGVHLSGPSSNCRIDKNRIHNAVGGAPAGSNDVLEDATGIYLTGDAPLGQENLVANNLVYDLNNSGNTYGIYNFSGDGAYIYHNTIYLEKAQQVLSPNVVAGFYQTTAATNIKFINNIISMQVPGSAIKSMLHFATPASVIESNHNVLRAIASGTQPAPNIGFTNNSGYSALAAWQATAGTPDLNSLIADPDFTSPLSGNFLPRNVAINNTGVALPVITDDFVGTLRNTTSPDPGAYEFSVTTGLAADAANQTISVWPNPFTTQLLVKSESLNTGNLTITVRNSVGKTVLQTVAKPANGAGQEELTLDANLPAGFYIIMLETAAGRFSKKLIKL